MTIHPGEFQALFYFKQSVESYPEFDRFKENMMAFLGQMELYRAQLERLLVLRFAIVNQDGLIAV